jgi:hypothetical protein
MSAAFAREQRPSGSPRLRDVLADRRLVWCLAGTTLA